MKNIKMEIGRLAVSENKALISGIAIILVVLYHSNPIICYPGFIGVDFFMFMSGYFLCRSFETHSLKNFYTRRFFRIFPMFLLLAVSIIVIRTLFHLDNLSPFDVFCTCTTLSYYNVGGIFVDWYLSSLFLFYLAFPFLYWLMGRKHNLIILTVMMTGIILLFASFDIHWKYETAIGRVPICCMGIMAYFEISKGKGKGSCIYAWFSIPFILLTAFLFVTHTHIQVYTLVYVFAPIILYAIGILIYKHKLLSNNYLWGGVQTIGNYTLEIYVGNVIAMNIVSNVGLDNRWVSMVICIVLTAILSTIVIFINRNIKKFFNLI